MRLSTRLLLCVTILCITVSSCSERESGKKNPIESTRSEFLRQISQWKQIPTKHQSAAFRVIPKLEAAVRFLEGRESVPVPYLIDAELSISRKEGADVDLKIVWIESQYSSSELRFYIGSELCDIKFAVEKVNKNVLVPLEELERGLVVRGVLLEDGIEWIDIGLDSEENTLCSSAERPSVPAAFITGPSRVSVLTQEGQESNSVEVFIRPDVHDLMATTSEDK